MKATTAHRLDALKGAHAARIRLHVLEVDRDPETGELRTTDPETGAVLSDADLAGLILQPDKGDAHEHTHETAAG